MFDDWACENTEKKIIITVQQNAIHAFNNQKKHDEVMMTDKEIIESDFLLIPELKLLKYQSIIITILKKHISAFLLTKINFDLNKFISYTTWLYKTTCHLSDLHKFKDVPYKIKNSAFDVPIILRNSYEFCNYNHKCIHCNNNTCTKKHFVYNYIKADLNEIIQYLKQDIEYNYKEIQVSINTIFFVINHMHDELTTRLNK